VIPKTILIVGLGNRILSDDGIGPLLVNDLLPIISNPEVQFTVVSSGGLEIMELIKDYKKVIIIDAIRTAKGNPGDVYYFLPAAFRETSNLSNLHDVNFLTALRLWKMLELNLPDELHIIAVEIIEDKEFSEELTPYMKKKYPEILKKVTDIIMNILQNINY
jgi:hydrogenase maturation protease